ncbi:NUAK family SNF1-like kinase 2 isoform X2 [Bos indicus]|uniref:non-specific serine/threonine protein kinase n=1 Tax=Bos indicus TaxID=9915 RepID=A0ABM4TEU4_BOSIN
MVLRDLKLGNLFLDANNNVKISNFVFNNQWPPGKKIDTFCGSPVFMAPELLLGMPYTGPEVDACSLGGVLYTMQETRSQGRRPESLPCPDPAQRRGPSPLA